MTEKAQRGSQFRRIWFPSLLSAISLMAGYGLGFALRGDSGVEELRAELTATRMDVENADAQTEAALARADAAEEELASRESEFVGLEAALEAREQQLEEEESDLREAEQRVASNTFGDGIWQVGVDFPAGLYRSPGGSDCYWALLSGANTGLDSIIQNGGFSANQTLQIDSPWFETSNCGEWTKIG
jgi:multidrug efflux pump subunit AcrA (membrane-fusion protein)